MDADARSPLDVIAAIGLAVGGAFGMAGTFVPQDALRQELWAIDGAALVVATALLTVKFGRQGCDCVAAGFLVFVAGESLLLAGNAAGLAASVPSYGGGVALWACVAHDDQHSLDICDMDASRWRRSGGSIRRHSRTYRLGRAPASDLLAPSDARLSVPGADLCWLDLAIAQTAGCLAAFFLTARVMQ